MDRKIKAIASVPEAFSPQSIWSKKKYAETKLGYSKAGTPYLARL
jgi:hypothetical protein